MKTYYVYAHYTLDTNECFYIGRGSDRRAWESGSKRNDYWNNIANKHGYKIEIIKDDINTVKKAVDIEVMLQLFFEPRACFSYGDSVNSILSEKTKAKISKSIKGMRYPPRTKQHKTKISARMLGNKAGLGHKKTKEVKEILKIKATNRNHTQKTKDKLKLINSRPIINCRNQIFISSKVAAEAVGVSASCISANLRKLGKSAGKYKDGTPIKWNYL